MNPESHITESQRQLLGAPAADELVRDEQWLEQTLGPADASDMPVAIRNRLTAAIQREVKAHEVPVKSGVAGGFSGAGDGPAHRGNRHRSEWRMAVAAVVLFAVLIGLFVRFILPGRPENVPSGIRPIPLAAIRDYEAQKAVNAYVGSVDSYMKTVDKDEVQMQVEIKHLDHALASADGADNPWAAVASVIEKGNP